MPRVTPEEVQAIFNTEADLQPYISVAHAIVERNLVGKCGHTESELKEIETWLAAHFASTAPASGPGRGGVTQDSFGDASRSFAFTGGARLHSSQYGQTAMLLDRCGVLSTLGERPATFKVL